MSARAWRLGATALVLGAVVACHREKNVEIAGLHSAAAPVYLVTDSGQKLLAVGAKLRREDRILAEGPAVIEYFGGGVHFMTAGRLDVGDADEAKLLSPTVPFRVVRKGRLIASQPIPRPVAVRYGDVSLTPEYAGPKPLGEADYLRAFFAPNGMEEMLKPRVAPPMPAELEVPPPFRPRIPHLHAGLLGKGGPRLDVQSGYVAAESAALTTAILRSGRAFALGTTRRLLLPEGARALLYPVGQPPILLVGPLDVRIE